MIIILIIFKLKNNSAEKTAVNTKNSDKYCKFDHKTMNDM